MIVVFSLNISIKFPWRFINRTAPSLRLIDYIIVVLRLIALRTNDWRYITAERIRAKSSSLRESAA